jgi:hypothetical protein
MSDYLIASLAFLFILDCITTHQILKAGGKELNGPLAKLMSMIGVDEALGLSKIIVLAFIMAMYVNDLFFGYELYVLGSINLMYAGIVVSNCFVLKNLK